MQISHFKRSTGLSVIFNDEIDIMEQVAINILIQISIHKTFWPELVSPMCYITYMYVLCNLGYVT